VFLHPAINWCGILAAMSNLASLAHEATKVPPGFDSTFYSTVATIVPFLFIAIAVQGPAYSDVIRVLGPRLVPEHGAQRVGAVLLLVLVTAAVIFCGFASGMKSIWRV